MNDKLLAAILQKVSFKGPETRRFQASAIYCAVRIYPLEVAADDIPEPLRPENPTTAGCVFALMKSEGQRIFERVGRRASRSPKRNCAWINTYRVNYGLALAWLRANGFPLPDAERDVQQGQELLPMN